MAFFELRGLIRRRVLVNFRVDPAVMQRQLPEPLRPKLLCGSALAGVCLIRLEQLRPKIWRAPLGFSSENAAHRVAVQWQDAAGDAHEGVYIPRRDSSSLFNNLVGGRLFPGAHHRAAFDVQAGTDRIELSMRSLDGSVAVELRGVPAPRLPESSKFASIEQASRFFEQGMLGYSETNDAQRLDGVLLVARNWRVQPLHVEHVYSSFFANPELFPEGSVEFDCALLMQNIEHEWQAAGRLAVRGRTNQRPQCLQPA